MKAIKEKSGWFVVYKSNSGRLHISRIFFALAFVAALCLNIASMTRHYPWVFSYFVEYIGPLELSWVRAGLMAIACACFAGALSERIARFYLSPVGIFLLPIAILTFGAAYRSHFGSTNALYTVVIYEDGPIEFLSALFFAVSSFLLIRIVIAKPAILSGVVRGCAAALAAFLGWVAAEEISYGQRVFGWQTPDALSAVNRQKETNIHNIASLEIVARHLGPLIIAAYGVFGWLVRILLQVGANSPLRWFKQFLPLFPRFHLVGYFLPLFLFSIVKFYLGENFWFALRDEELYEFLLSMGFLLFAIDWWRQSRSMADRNRYARNALEAA